MREKGFVHGLLVSAAAGVLKAIVRGMLSLWTRRRHRPRLVKMSPVNDGIRKWREREHRLASRRLPRLAVALGFGAGALGAALGGLLVALVANSEDVQLGNVAEAGGAIGTILALVYAGRAFRHEMDVRRDEEQQRATAEARRFTCLREHVSAGRTGDVFHADGQFEIHNASQTTFESCAFRVRIDSTMIEQHDVGQVISGRSQTHPFKFRCPVSERPEGTIIAEVEFTDPGGRRWLSSSDGTTRRVDQW